VEAGEGRAHRPQGEPVDGGLSLHLVAAALARQTGWGLAVLAARGSAPWLVVVRLAAA
jgi:hypothetical protein